MSIHRLYRKHPIVSTVATAGTVNVLLGMVEGQALLAFLGVLVVSSEIAIRGWQGLRRPTELPDTSSTRYLPNQTARPAILLPNQKPERGDR